VRLGTAEIYGVLEGLPEIADAIATGVEEGGDVKILLFVVLAEGVALDEALRARIREAIRRDASPRHVPAEIHPIDEVPRTISGKPVEIAVARVLRGEDPGNRDALANPAALDAFRRRR
jgi:acetoacetyl-CoA synthetase